MLSVRRNHRSQCERQKRKLRRQPRHRQPHRQVLNPLSEIAGQGDLVIGVWVHAPNPLVTGSACVADLAALFASDNDVIPGGQPIAFQGKSGAWFVGMAFRVPVQSSGKVYDQILKPLSQVNVLPLEDVLGYPLTLAFVDYGNGIGDASAVAQTVANADTGSSLVDQMSWLSAFDSVGALTPYVQQQFASQVSAQQTERSIVGQTAAAAEKAGTKIRDLSVGASASILFVIVGGLLVAKLLAGAGSQLVEG